VNQVSTSQVAKGVVGAYLRKRGPPLVFASEWGPCAPVSEGEGSVENRKKKEKQTRQRVQQVQKRKKGDSLLAFASKRGCPSAPVERKGTVSGNEKKKEKVTDAKESLLGGGGGREQQLGQSDNSSGVTSE
jgi:hypothetical protein